MDRMTKIQRSTMDGCRGGDASESAASSRWNDTVKRGEIAESTRHPIQRRDSATPKRKVDTISCFFFFYVLFFCFPFSAPNVVRLPFFTGLMRTATLMTMTMSMTMMGTFLFVAAVSLGRGRWPAHRWRERSRREPSPPYKSPGRPMEPSPVDLPPSTNPQRRSQPWTRYQSRSNYVKPR